MNLKPHPRRRERGVLLALLWTALMRRSVWRLWRALRMPRPQATVWC